MSYHNLSQPHGARASTEFHQWLDTALGGDAPARKLWAGSVGRTPVAA